MTITIAEAITRYTSGKKLPRKGAVIINGLIVVETDPIQVGTEDGGCAPVFQTQKVIVPVSLEPVADISNKVHFEQDSDPRQLDLSGGYFGRRTLLPTQLFDSSFKTVFYANADFGNSQRWVEFEGDVQSLGNTSISTANRLSVPLAIRGVVFTPVIDLAARLAEING